MTVRTRFAPSPTGRLHVGNIRTALHNWLWARAQGGEFWLRIDDTDAERSEERYVEAIRADLDWLGMTPDGETRQSARFDLYEVRFAALRAAGRVYPAYETAQELDLKRKVAAGRGLPPVYDRAALALSDADRAALEADSVRPHWRFRLDHDAPIAWHDLVRGEQRFDAATMSDPVIRRADGSWLYMLPSAIDDVAMGISHVVRGEDHVSNTALQLQMFDAMGVPPPAFAHAALLTGAEGKLSKRLGSLGVDHFREAGIEPAAVRALLARIGTEPAGRAGRGARAADRDVRFRRVRPGARAFRRGRARRAQHAHRPRAALCGRRRPPAGGHGRGRVGRGAPQPRDRCPGGRMVEGDRRAGDGGARPGRCGLPCRRRAGGRRDRLSGDPWHALTAALKAQTGRGGKALFLPLRLALTGRASGPDMQALLPLIGRDRAIERFSRP